MWFLLASVAATAAGETRFLSVGDWGMGSLDVDHSAERSAMEDVAAAVNLHARNTSIDFVLALGDNFYEDGVRDVSDPLWDDAWRDVWMGGALSGRKFYAILGNHDYHLGDQAAQSQVDRQDATDDDEWTMPSRVAYTVRNEVKPGVEIAIVAIDTARLAPHETSHTPFFIGSDLVNEALIRIDHEIAAAAEYATWLLVAGHYPIFSVGEHGNTQALIELLLPILRARGVDAYLCGHDHTLQALQDDVSPLTFLVSGNGCKVTGYFHEFVFLDSVTSMLRFHSTLNGFTSHVVTADSLQTSFISSSSEVLHEFRQLPRKDKCSSASLEECPKLIPTESASNYKKKSSKKDGVWHVGVAAGIIILLSWILSYLLAALIRTRGCQKLWRKNSSYQAELGLVTRRSHVPSSKIVDENDERSVEPNVPNTSTPKGKGIYDEVPLTVENPTTGTAYL